MPCDEVCNDDNAECSAIDDKKDMCNCKTGYELDGATSVCKASMYVLHERNR